MAMKLSKNYGVEMCWMHANCLMNFDHYVGWVFNCISGIKIFKFFMLAHTVAMAGYKLNKMEMS